MNTSDAINNNNIDRADSNHQNTLPLVIAIPIIIVTGITAIVNLAFILVCFRALKKKFHNLLVLTLCLSDFFLDVSIVCFCLSSISKFLQTNVKLCLFQMFTIFFGFATTYSTVFVICYERFLIVQSRNFGMNQFLDRFKYAFIFLTLGLDFLVTFQTTFFIPHANSIESCSPSNLYKDEYIKSAEIFAISITFILIFIVITIIRTNCLIWTIFFKRRNNLVAHRQENDTSTDHNSSTQTPVHRLPCQQPGTFDHTQMDTWADDQFSCQQPGTSGLYRNHRIENDYSSESKDPTSPHHRNMIRLKIGTLVNTLKKNRQSVEPKGVKMHIEKTQKSQPQSLKFGAWEKRAFITSLIIALMTVILTFPFICSFWHDIYSDTLMSKETRMYLVFPLIINSVSNPFLYAWRVPEIKKEFQKLFHLKN